jgi:hypothetical protein
MSTSPSPSAAVTAVGEVFDLREMGRGDVVESAVARRQEEQILFAGPFRCIVLWKLRPSVAGKRSSRPSPLKSSARKVLTHRAVGGGPAMMSDVPS